MIGTIFTLTILIFLSGFMSAAETALTTVNRFTVQYLLKQKKPGSILLSRLKKNPHRMLSTLLILSNILNVTASVIATDFALKIFSSYALAITSGVMTFLLLTFTDILPKNYAASNSQKVALITGPIVYILSFVLFPINWFFMIVTEKIFRIQKPKYQITKKELKNIILMARKESGINIDKIDTEQDEIQEISKEKGSRTTDKRKSRRILVK